MPTALDKSEKLAQIDNIHTNTFHLVKKMNIGPVDIEIVLLKLEKKKETRNAWQSLAYSQLGAP